MDAALGWRGWRYHQGCSDIKFINPSLDQGLTEQQWPLHTFTMLTVYKLELGKIIVFTMHRNAEKENNRFFKQRN